MKVYSLYYRDNFVAAFSNREECVDYGKIHYTELAWDCNIIEEYLTRNLPQPQFPLVQVKPSEIKRHPYESPWTCSDSLVTQRFTQDSGITFDYSKPVEYNINKGES